VLEEEGKNPSLFYHLPNCQILENYLHLAEKIHGLPV
jgi:hypothetical protein